MALRNQLVIMAKAPRIGRVKTRLAKGIGSIKAWMFYRRTLEAVSRPLNAGRRWQTWLAVSPDQTVHDARVWPITGPRLTQGSGNLGHRMGRVMEIMGPGPVVIIGADIPDIRTHHISAAFKALGHHDAVFGPADDGGYWLVGLKRRPTVADLFHNVRWSTQHALADTRANLPADAKVAYLETLTDVDDVFSLARRDKKRS
jgi:uncharacterized protein